MSEKQERVVNAIVVSLSRVGAVQVVGTDIKIRVSAEAAGEKDETFTVRVVAL